MIDLKATLDSIGMTQYQFGKEIGRHRNQVGTWCMGKHKISPLMLEKVLAYFKGKGIKVIDMQ